MNHETRACLVSERRGACLWLHLDRPERANALDTTLLGRLIASLRGADADPDVAKVVIAARGRVFCAGVDLKELAALDNPGAYARRRQLIATVLVTLHEMSTPVVAVVRGPALGAGAALVMACDMAVADTTARLGFPEAAQGILPGVVLPGLARQLPPKLAFEVLTCGRELDAVEATRFGLLNRVVEPSDLGGAVDVVLASWATAGADIVAQIKDLLGESESLQLATAVRLGADGVT